MKKITMTDNRWRTNRHKKLNIERINKSMYLNTGCSFNIY